VPGHVPLGCCCGRADGDGIRDEPFGRIFLHKADDGSDARWVEVVPSAGEKDAGGSSSFAWKPSKKQNDAHRSLSVWLDTASRATVIFANKPGAGKNNVVEASSNGRGEGAWGLHGQLANGLKS